MTTTYFSNEMLVTKRNGNTEDISFDKILNRIKTLGMESNIQVNYSDLAMKVIEQLYNKIDTSKIDELTSEQCASMSTIHYDYSTLASLVSISNHQKNTQHTFMETVERLFEAINSKGEKSPIVTEEFYKYCKENEEELEKTLDYSRDYLIDYFGYKTLERAYLFKINQKIVERIQHMWMRVSIGIHMTTSYKNKKQCLENVKETYNLMSQKYFTHATPTLFNAGTHKPQMSSCYLLATENDSIEGIYNTLGECAQISKWSGGIGLHINNIRSKGSEICGTNGTSNGIVPMLRVFNNSARYVDQGGNKRPGSIAIYLEPWHADVSEFLEMKKNHGDEETKARDLFYGLWINDLFMERVEKNEKWSLFCPNECKGLSDTYGEEFKIKYEGYEKEGKARIEMDARKLWFQILDAQMETGNPYILYKDSANKKSNQKNLGTIKSSNLCCEIIEYSDDKETAVCNLASIALPAFVNSDSGSCVFDYDKLHEIVKVVTYNLNKVIDINFYPSEKTRVSNMRHRPIGIGVQGLADVFMLLDVAFTSNEAKAINRQIFETIYHASVEKSYEMSRQLFDEGDDNYNKLIGSYETFKGSPISEGKFQFDLWNTSPSERYDWGTLRSNIMTYGMRNSLLVAPMPTASTSQILGYNECFEPFTSNIYSRSTLAGEFVRVNKYLIRELIEMNKWDEEIKNNIILNKGSVQQLSFLSPHTKEKYKIVWEMKMKDIIDMAAERGVYVCQSQSMNLWMEDPNYSALTNMHFYSWRKGLKTGMYYLRRKAKHNAQQFTIEPELKKPIINSNDEDNDICHNCSA